MEKGRRSKNFIKNIVEGKGFYVVLLLCVVAVGTTGYVITNENRELATAREQIEEESQNKQSVIAQSEQEAPLSLLENDFKNEETPKEGEIEGETPFTPKTPFKEEPLEQGSIMEEESVGAMKQEETKITLYRAPVTGRVSTPYSMGELIYSKTMEDYRTHNGTDMKAELGKDVMATAKGRVEKIYMDDLMGYTVMIDHGNNMKSLYANLQKEFPIKVGDTVVLGDVIGYVGDTAAFEKSEESHLHFEMIVDGKQVDPEQYVTFIK